jgi:hypothetical protein
MGRGDLDGVAATKNRHIPTGSAPKEIATAPATGTAHRP